MKSKMKKHFNRGPKNWAKTYSKIYFRKGNNFISENLNVFVKKYNVHSFIRILPPDFKLIKKNMNRFTHFNIQNTISKPGKNYLIIRIHKRGYYDGITYKQPILESSNFILAKCLSVQNNIDYVNLKKGGEGRIVKIIYVEMDKEEEVLFLRKLDIGNITTKDI